MTTERIVMKNLLYFTVVSCFLLALASLCGCDRPEVSPDSYGTIVEKLPDLEDAKAPYPFPDSYKPKETRSH